MRLCPKKLPGRGWRGRTTWRRTNHGSGNDSRSTGGGELAGERRPSSGWRVAAVLCLAMIPRVWADEPFQKRGDWKPVFQGIELLELEAKEPRLMHGHVVRIALRTKGLRFLATPDNGERPQHTDGLKTSTFLTRYQCQVAINASPFSPIHAEEDLPQHIECLTVSEGRIVSPERAGYPALLISRDNRVAIAPPPFALEDVQHAVCGFGIVLQQGQVREGGPDVHPRTAAGVSQDGHTLYLLVIDGRQPLYSLGATTREVGEWLAALGAHDGINLDGGGTTTLAIEHPGGVRVVNRPVHGGWPGKERVTGSHLGVYAPPLDQKPPE
uniref:Phosphodiester glycosidase family protein n=1 Tax=Schlesneria paludicola TaxID=360056 RepID=A0A7C4LKW1_9PLAN